MANTNENTLSVKITEKDTIFLEQACYCLNQARLNSCMIRLGYDSVQNRIKISAKRDKQLDFNISFAVNDFDEEMSDELATINKLNRQLYYFFFSSKSNELDISVYPTSTTAPKTAKVTLPNFELKDDSNFHKFSVPLADIMPVTEHMLQLFNIVKIRQLLIVTENFMKISALGDDSSFSLSFGIVSDTDIASADPYSKFNYLNSVGCLNYFKIRKIANGLPQSLKIATYPIAGKDDEYYKANSLMDSITAKVEE